METYNRRVLRMTLGVTVSVVLSQFWPWSLSYVMPVLVALLLQERHPMPYKKGVRAIGSAIAFIAIGYLVAIALLPYPLLLIAALFLLLWRLYLFMLTSGAPILTIVGAIIGVLVVPVLVPISPDVARGVAAGLMLDLVGAYGIAQVAFLFIPPGTDTMPAPKPAPPPAVARALALKLVVAIGPIMITFLLFGLTDILLLNIAATVALAMGARGGWEMGMTLVTANLVFAGIAMLLTYELLVIAPSPVFLAAVMVCIIWIFARKILAETPRSEMWASALNGFLLLTGSALLSESAVAGDKLIARAGQILIATLYVALAYQTVDLVISLRLKAVSSLKRRKLLRSVAEHSQS